MSSQKALRMPETISEPRERGPFSTPSITQLPEDGVRYPRPNHSSDRLAEWLFALMMVSWGLWLLNPDWDTFESPQYALLKQLASEPVWGAWSLAIGIIRVCALYINGSHYRTPAVRSVCAGLGVCWWVVLTFLFLSNPATLPAAGFAWYPLFVVFEAICVARSARDGWHTRAFSRRVTVG